MFPIAISFGLGVLAGGAGMYFFGKKAIDGTIAYFKKVEQAGQSAIHDYKKDLQ